MNSKLSAPFAIMAALATLGPGISAATPSGEAVYQQRCASCHDSGSSKVPTKDALKKLPVVRIRTSMDFGTMGSVATTLRRDERDAVAAYLGVAGVNEAPPAKAFCADRKVKLAGSPKVAWNGWSSSSGNTRYQPGDAAGVTLDQVRRLKLKWAYGFDHDIVAFAQPSVLDRYLFVGSASGMIQALSPAAQITVIELSFLFHNPPSLPR
ncbi:MAG TPA: cytochrome c [Bryobacteraceae bacterium]